METVTLCDCARLLRFGGVVVCSITDTDSVLGKPLVSVK